MNHPIEGLMDTTLQKIKEMVDVNTVIGTPIATDAGTVIIPVSKVSYGFASGGSDFPSKQPKDLFGGGTGAGITINPQAFLIVSNHGEVKLLQMSTSSNTADKAVNIIPEVIDKISELLKKDKTEKAEAPQTETVEKPKK